MSFQQDCVKNKEMKQKTNKTKSTLNCSVTHFLGDFSFFFSFFLFLVILLFDCGELNSYGIQSCHFRLLVVTEDWEAVLRVSTQER